ncbi:MAG TPA: hypothetical protein VGB66_03725 [Longimicrobium sp.]|jgi:hypothetical protein
MRRILIALAALAALPAATRAQSTRDDISQLLTQAAGEARQKGYASEARVFDPRGVIGMLPRTGSVVLEVNLRAGVRYTVIGVCDADCADLDLRAHAVDGQRVLDEDVSTDDVPLLTFTAAETGPHPLAVIMTECRTALCYFGVKVLAR